MSSASISDEEIEEMSDEDIKEIEEIEEIQEKENDIEHIIIMMLEYCTENRLKYCAPLNEDNQIFNEYIKTSGLVKLIYETTKQIINQINGGETKIKFLTFFSNEYQNQYLLDNTLIDETDIILIVLKHLKYKIKEEYKKIEFFLYKFIPDNYEWIPGNLKKISDLNLTIDNVGIETLQKNKNMIVLIFVENNVSEITNDNIILTELNIFRENIAYLYIENNDLFEQLNLRNIIG